MRMFAKRFQNGWKPTQHTVALPTDQTHDFIHVLWILLSQIQNLTKLNKLFNNKMKISTIVFAAMAISSADAYPLLLPTGAILVTSKLSRNYRLKLYLVILLSVPMSLMLWLQKTWNVSLTTLLPSSFQATSLAGDSILLSAHHRFAKSSPDNSLRGQRLVYGWLYRLSWLCYFTCLVSVCGQVVLDKCVQWWAGSLVPWIAIRGTMCQREPSISLWIVRWTHDYQRW
jgi:hypothetical protein